MNAVVANELHSRSRTVFIVTADELANEPTILGARNDAEIEELIVDHLKKVHTRTLVP